MRWYLGVAAVSAIALGTQAALAQSAAQSGAQDIRPGNDIGTRASLPLTRSASNIGPGDTHSPIAPTPPLPDVGPDANVRQYLQAAGRALRSGQGGEAQEALERAETRVLDRSVLASQTNHASGNPFVAEIDQALGDLGNRDKQGAATVVAQLLSSGAPELAD